MNLAGFAKGSYMANNECSEAERLEVLALLPQTPPFRFIDRLLELSDSHAVSEYRFTGEESFYKGHFAGNPVTPGVILVEVMAQTGLVALGIHLLRKENREAKLTTLFTDCQVEFLDVVRPNALVTARAEKVFWRMNKLRSKVEVTLENGAVAASGTISGMGVVLS